MAFFVAGAIPTLAAIILFAVPFLLPPSDHPFWRGKLSSKQLLISTSSQSSGTDNNNNNSKDMDCVDARILNCDPGIASNHQSYASLSSINLMHLQKKISMREIGSISSFGSVIFSPVGVVGRITPKKSNSLVVVDTVTHV